MILPGVTALSHYITLRSHCPIIIVHLPIIITEGAPEVTVPEGCVTRPLLDDRE